MRPEFQHLVDTLQKRIDQKSSDLARGAAKDYAEYKYLAGMINGLREAATEITDYGRAYDDAE